MGLIAKYKLQFGLYKLNKLLRDHKRVKKVHNFESARSVGIICPASSDEVFVQALELSNYLNQRNIEVALLIYCPLKEVPQKFLLRKNVNVFNINEINWYGKPMVPIAEEFANKEFEILIDLSLQEIFPIRWIASLSKAKFKVGALNYLGSPNDFILCIGKHNVAFLVEQIVHYLSILNNRFAQEKQLLVEK
jgi:hypothetical protein